MANSFEAILRYTKTKEEREINDELTAIEIDLTATFKGRLNFGDDGFKIVFPLTGRKSDIETVLADLGVTSEGQTIKLTLSSIPQTIQTHIKEQLS